MKRALGLSVMVGVLLVSCAKTDEVQAHNSVNWQGRTDTPTLSAQQRADILSGDIRSVTFPNGEIVTWNVEPDGTVSADDMGGGVLADLPERVDKYTAFLKSDAPAKIAENFEAQQIKKINRLKAQGYGQGIQYDLRAYGSSQQVCTFWFIGCWNWQTQTTTTYRWEQTYKPLWPGGNINFSFDPNISPLLRSAFRQAMDEWNADQQRRYNPQSPKPLPIWRENAADPERVIISQVYAADWGGMSEYIGYFPDGKTQFLKINLSDWNGTLLSGNVPSRHSIGILLHEMGHAAGLFHEHQRPDRDQYLVVNTGNANSNFLGNLNKIERTNTGTIAYTDQIGAFDYGSVMMYWPTAYSINGQPTLIGRPQNNNWIGNPNDFGRQEGLSNMDGATLYWLYYNNN